MEWKYLLWGAIIGGVVGFWRMKTSPTSNTSQAKGFGG